MFARLISIVLLASLGATSIEAGFGVAKDGRIHHSDAAAASEHQLAAGLGDHTAHHQDMDSQSVDERGHSRESEEGSAGDHCAHVHGFGLTQQPIPDNVATVHRFALAAVRSTPPAQPASPPIRPPRA